MERGAAEPPPAEFSSVHEGIFSQPFSLTRDMGTWGGTQFGTRIQGPPATCSPCGALTSLPQVPGFGGWHPAPAVCWWVSGGAAAHGWPQPLGVGPHGLGVPMAWGCYFLWVLVVHGCRCPRVPLFVGPHGLWVPFSVGPPAQWVPRAHGGPGCCEEVADGPVPRGSGLVTKMRPWGCPGSWGQGDEGLPRQRKR